jgi:uncharacterized protein with HEPN domain
LPSSRPRQRLIDIVDNIEAITRYTRGLDEKGFAVDDKTVDAVERCLSRLSEAAKKLGKTGERLAPDQPWKQIRDLGNLLRHEYDLVRRDVIWEIISEDLPRLQTACLGAIAKIDGSG